MCCCCSLIRSNSSDDDDMADALPPDVDSTNIKENSAGGRKWRVEQYTVHDDSRYLERCLAIIDNCILEIQQMKSSIHAAQSFVNGIRLTIGSPVPGLQTRLQNGVGRDSQWNWVCGSLDMENDRGARPPSCHVSRYGRIKHGCRRPCWKSHFFTVKSIYTGNTSKLLNMVCRIHLWYPFVFFYVSLTLKGHGEGYFGNTTPLTAT